MVRAFSLRDVTDAIELRGVLEGTAARLAAEQGADPEKITEIKAILDRLDACFAASGDRVDFDAYSELNGVFHDRLAALCQSPVILRELDRVKSLPFASPSAFVLGDRRMPPGRTACWRWRRCSTGRWCRRSRAAKAPAPRPLPASTRASPGQSGRHLRCRRTGAGCDAGDGIDHPLTGARGRAYIDAENSHREREFSCQARGVCAVCIH